MNFSEDKFLLVLICVFHFLIRGVLNLFFVISQTIFFGTAGVTSLPFVYAFMNLIYIALQSFSVSRLSQDSASRIERIAWVFFGLLLIRQIIPHPESVWISTFFLLLVMVFDLFFTQFFLHFLQEVFSLQEGKTFLPIVTGFGSLSFIVSGFLMKVLLEALSFRDLMAIGAVILGISNVLFGRIRRIRDENIPLEAEETKEKALPN
ncbi:hypothetical protein HYY75_09825, partial [bacterium]|nr:hypothetical protein [bacterium]